MHVYTFFMFFLKKVYDHYFCTVCYHLLQVEFSSVQFRLLLSFSISIRIIFWLNSHINASSIQFNTFDLPKGFSKIPFAIQSEKNYSYPNKSCSLKWGKKKKGKTFYRLEVCFCTKKVPKL